MKSTPSGRVVAEHTCESAWLLELFEAQPRPGNDCCASLGFYVETLSEHGLSCTSTASPWAAKRSTKEEAEAIAPRLLNKLGVWRAIEHGFCGG